MGKVSHAEYLLAAGRDVILPEATGHYPHRYAELVEFFNEHPEEVIDISTIERSGLSDISVTSV